MPCKYLVTIKLLSAAATVEHEVSNIKLDGSRALNHQLTRAAKALASSSIHRKTKTHPIMQDADMEQIYSSGRDRETASKGCVGCAFVCVCVLWVTRSLGE